MQIDTATTTFRDSKIDPNIHTESSKNTQLHASISKNDPENIPESRDLRKFRGFVLTTSGWLPRLFRIKLSSHKDPNSKCFSI
jgi:hypothetical protein